MTISIATRQEDNSKYVPVIDFPELIKGDAHLIRRWMLEVDLWSDKVVTDKNTDDEETIEEISDMVLLDNYAAANQKHIEFINFAFQTRRISNIKTDLDMDMLELYLSYMCDRCREL